LGTVRGGYNIINKVVGPFTRIVYEDINLNSDAQIKEYLLSVGWIPTTYNRVFDKDTRQWRQTSPKLTEDSFDSISDNTGQLVAERSILVHRRRTIKNYKDPENKGIIAQIRDRDGRVPAEGNLNSAITGRTAHRRAVCNVPKNNPKVKYGKEMRSLFRVYDPYIMLGADLDQIEARITSHYAWAFDGGAYWRVLEEVDDIHQYNADLINSDRDTAKGFQYAIFFGAQATKLASIIGCTVKKAQVYIDNFWEGNRGVYDLVEYLKKYYKKYGFIRGLDGRKLKVRAEYKLLNTLIQSAAAIVFKRWGVIAMPRLREAGLDCKQIIAYHDEYDYRCLPTDEAGASRIIKKAAIDAGRFYHMKVPITVDVKRGMSWADVH
jgi:DNA polymerase-1